MLYHLYRPDPEELAELKEAIAESEAEDAQGVIISHDDIKRMVAEMIRDQISPCRSDF